MSISICSECGCPVEIAEGEEWGYCPMCENDQVELKRNFIDTKKVVKLGDRKKYEIRECCFCKRDCRKTYYCDEIDNKQVWVCKYCFKKIQKEMKSE